MKNMKSCYDCKFCKIRETTELPIFDCKHPKASRGQDGFYSCYWMRTKECGQDAKLFVEKENATEPDEFAKRFVELYRRVANVISGADCRDLNEAFPDKAERDIALRVISNHETLLDQCDECKLRVTSANGKDFCSKHEKGQCKAFQLL